MVIWIIGMSSSGKTTLGKILHEKLKLSNEKWVFLDGDIYRNILGEDLGHTIEDREKNGQRISKLSEFFDKNNINVIACVLSIFHKHQEYNRKKIKDYFEVYIKVDFEKLLKRDNKRLYEDALDGKIKDVIGVDIDFVEPKSPDYIIDNNNEPKFYEEADNIIQKLKLSTKYNYPYTNSNLLKNPTKYQYTKFYGKDFLSGYELSRYNFIKSIKLRLPKKSKSKKTKSKILELNIYNESDLILNNFLHFVRGADNNQIYDFKEIIDFLLKRFEVSKKLFKTYDKNKLKKTSEEYMELENYPLFSICLQSLYHFTSNKEEKLIYLNTILKINDLIISIIDQIILADQINYSIEAINGELNITRNYYD